MDLIKFRAATIVLMAITAIIAAKDDYLPITFGNIVIMFAINSTSKLRLLCLYSFFCMMLSIDYVKKKKLFLLYLIVVIAHIIQIVSAINIFFSTM